MSTQLQFFSSSSQCRSPNETNPSEQKVQYTISTVAQDRPAQPVEVLHVNKVTDYKYNELISDMHSCVLASITCVRCSHFHVTWINAALCDVPWSNISTLALYKACFIQQNTNDFEGHR